MSPDWSGRTAMICHACGIEAPTKHVVFYQNVGMLVMRQSKAVEGSLCKRCVHAYFWELSAITFAFGWWSVTSVLITPFYLLNNLVRYASCLGMNPPPEAAEVPQLTERAADRLEPYAEEIMDRMYRGESIDRIAEDIAPQAKVRPALVIVFAFALANEGQDESY